MAPASLPGPEPVAPSSARFVELAAVLSGLPDLIVLLDENGHYHRIFTGAAELLPKPAEKLLGTTIHDVFPSDIAQRMQTAIDVALVTCSSHEASWTLEVMGGTRCFDGHLVPVTFDGRPCVLWVAHDATTTLVPAEGAQPAPLVDEGHAPRPSRLSHELAPAMEGIAAITHLLGQSELSSDQRAMLKHIEMCASQLRYIVDGSVAAPAAGGRRRRVRDRPFDVADTLYQVVDYFRRRYANRPVTFSFSADPRLPAVLRGDPERLRQISMSMIANAVALTQEGEISVRVVVQSEGADELRLRIEFSDTGTGIPQEALQAIFDPFADADPSAARGPSGPSVRLTMVREYAESMQGDLEVHNVLGQGTTFSLSLPLRRDDMVAAIKRYAAGTARTRITHAPRVLVAEDNPIGQLVAGRFLASLGCQVEIVSNGMDAVKAAARAPFDVILMDCQMPILDGYEATRRIRAAEGPDQHVPIIAITGQVIESSQRACLEAGMDDYLTKPLLEEVLRAVLENWVGPAQAEHDPRH